jgi:hypothetical protein
MADRKEYFKKYYLEHRDQIRQRSLKGYEDNKQKRLEYARAYYDKKREEILAKLKEKNRQEALLRPPKIKKEKSIKIKKEKSERKKRFSRIRTNKEIIHQLKDVPCMDCGIKYNSPSMHFDHRDPSIKVKNVSAMVGGSTEDLLREIAKCDIVCANCHAERTWGKGRKE